MASFFGRDVRYRACCTVVYQCGLRLSEAIAINPRGINGECLVIFIPATKNQKEHEVPITLKLLAPCASSTPATKKQLALARPAPRLERLRQHPDPGHAPLPQVHEQVRRLAGHQNRRRRVWSIQKNTTAYRSTPCATIMAPACSNAAHRSDRFPHLRGVKVRPSHPTVPGTRPKEMNASFPRPKEGALELRSSV